MSGQARVCARAPTGRSKSSSQVSAVFRAQEEASGIARAYACVSAQERREGAFFGEGKTSRLSRSSRLRPPRRALPRRGLRRRPFRGPWRFLAAFSLRATGGGGGGAAVASAGPRAQQHPPSPAHSPSRTYLHKDLLDVEPRLGRRVHANDAGVGGVRLGLVGGHGAALAHVGLVARQRNDHGGVAAPLQLLDPRLGALERVACRRGRRRGRREERGGASALYALARSERGRSREVTS